MKDERDERIEALKDLADELRLNGGATDFFEMIDKKTQSFFHLDGVLQMRYDGDRNKA